MQCQQHMSPFRAWCQEGASGHMTQKYNKTLGTNQHRNFKTTWITSLGSGRKIVFGGWNMMKPGGPDPWLLSRCTRFLLLQVVRKSPKPNRVAEWNHLFSNKNKHKSMCMYYVCMSYQHISENTQIQEVICLARFLGIESWQFWIFPFKTNMIWSLIIASAQVSSKPLTIRTTHDYMISFSFLDLCSFKSRHERNARQICKYWLITIANLQHRS